MKHATLLFAAPALLALAPKTGGTAEAERISFRPTEGASVTKVFTNTMVQDLENMSVLMNGEENAMMPEVDMSMETVSRITVTDTYGKLSAGRPTLVRRTFDDIDMSFGMEMSADGGLGGGEQQTSKGKGSSPLKGRQVDFTWDEEEGDYNRTWVDAEARGKEQYLLADLVEDMDVRRLLPVKDLEVGESYTIDLIGLVDVLAPGGDLKLEMEVDGESMGIGPGGPDAAMMSNIRRMFGDMLEGEATGTLREVKDEGGQRLAVIALAVEIDTANDMSEMLRDLMAETAQEGMQMTLDRVDAEFTLEASGELVWNLSKGHVHSLTLEGDTAIAMDIAMTIDFGGQSMTMEMVMEMAGALESLIETK